MPGSIKFCEDCKSILTPKKEDGKVFLSCLKCNLRYDVDPNEKTLIRQAKRDRNELTVVIDSSKADFRNEVEHKCEKCGYTKAIMNEIKASQMNDEQTEVLYRCLHCNDVVRDTGRE